MSLILAVVLSKSTFSFTCTKTCHEWFPHCVCASFNHVSVVTYLSQGNKNFVSKNVELCGRSSKTAATLASNLLSSLIVLPIGLISPKSAFASDCVRSIEDGSLNPFTLPFKIFNESKRGNSGCAHMPECVSFLSPTARICSKFQDVRVTYLKSLVCLFRNSNPIAIETAGPVPV